VRKEQREWAMMVEVLILSSRETVAKEPSQLYRETLGEAPVFLLEWSVRAGCS